jgi:hypothetical protein
MSERLSHTYQVFISGVNPGSPQRAFNAETATAAVEVLAIGAPPVSGDVHAYEP